MSNYPYIIAGLPNLALDFKSNQFDYASLVAQIRSFCSKEDCRLIDWLEFGMSDDNVNSHFYRAVSKSGSRFLAEFFAFDKELRTAKVEFLETGKCGKSFEKAFTEKNLIDREKLIDQLKWQKTGEIVLFEVLSMDIILAFLAKARIVERWCRLDQQTGEEMFKNLVQEVRGTFKGIKEITI